jgi:hypothetical protein
MYIDFRKKNVAWLKFALLANFTYSYQLRADIEWGCGGV